MSTPELEQVSPYYVNGYKHDGRPPDESRSVAIIPVGKGTRIYVDLLRWNVNNESPKWVVGVRKFVKGKGPGEEYRYFPTKTGISFMAYALDPLLAALSTAANMVEEESRAPRPRPAPVETPERAPDPLSEERGKKLLDELNQK